MKVPSIDFSPHDAELRRDLDAAHARVMDSGQFILGKELQAFEAAFAAYCGVAHCVGVANGLDALTLALRALGLAPGDEVVVPAHTFVATWLAVSAAGGVPRPAPVDARTFNLDPAALARVVTPRTRGIIAVHLYGLPAAMDAIKAFAAARGLFVLEDAAQAHGATAGGVRTGALGDCAAFSFYPTKNLGARGDAGAVTTNDGALAERLRRLRSYGESRKYHCEEPGVNSRLDELQAAFLGVGLARLDRWNELRRAQARVYDEVLAKAGVATPVTPPGLTHVFHQYVIRVPDRDRFLAAVSADGVDARVHYPVAVHRQGCYAAVAQPAGGGLELAEALAASVVSLPIGPHLGLDQVRYAADVVARRLR